MAELLKIEYAGQLAGDPVMRYTPQGTAVCEFSTAYNNKHGDVDETTWVRWTVWGKKAEATNKWTKKGTKVYLQGYLKPDPDTGGPRIWYSKDEPDTPRASYEATAYNIVFISDLNDGGKSESEFVSAEEDFKQGATRGLDLD